MLHAQLVAFVYNWQTALSAFWTSDGIPPKNKYAPDWFTLWTKTFDETFDPTEATKAFKTLEVELKVPFEYLVSVYPNPRTPSYL